MTIGGYKKEIDYERLGPTMMIAASLILAVRTARRPTEYSDNLSNREWEEEFAFAVKVASSLLSIAIQRKPELFKHKDVAWHVPDDSDVQP
jgi:hypothetical protein